MRLLFYLCLGILFCFISCNMFNRNPIYKHQPDEFFDGQYLLAAKAIREGRQSALKAILNGESASVPPVNPNFVGRQGMTLMLWAASHDNIEAVASLIDHGADPDQKIVNLEGDSIQLFAIAAKGKSDALFNLLLERGVDPNGRDRDEPALLSAIYADRFDRVQKILENGGDINITNGAKTPAIVVLARLDNYVRVLELLEKGAALTPANADDLIFFINEYPQSPGSSQYESQLKVKQFIIDKGYQFPEIKK